MLATSKDDAIYILEILTLEFAGICSILSAKKAKVLTTHVHDFLSYSASRWLHIDAIADFKYDKILGEASCFSKIWIYDHSIAFRIAVATRAFYAERNLVYAKHMLYDHFSNYLLYTIFYKRFTPLLS